MFQISAIGNLGNDAELKNLNGKVYLTFRLAHSEKYTKSDGTTCEETTWISCITSNFTNLAQYLKKGQKVFVSGEGKVNVIWNPKTKQHVSGVNINIRTIELCGGSKQQDEIPSLLYDGGGVQHNVSKLFWTENENGALAELYDQNAVVYNINEHGFISKPQIQQQQQQTQDNN